MDLFACFSTPVLTYHTGAQTNVMGQ